MQLARRVMEAAGARPAVGAAENGAWPIYVIDAPQFGRDEIERPGPGDRHVSVAPPLPVRARTALEPAAPNHRLGDPRRMRNRSGNVAEQRRRIRIAWVWQDRDLPLAEPHRKGAPVRAVRDELRSQRIGHAQLVLKKLALPLHRSVANVTLMGSFQR